MISGGGCSGEHRGTHYLSKQDAFSKVLNSSVERMQPYSNIQDDLNSPTAHSFKNNLFKNAVNTKKNISVQRCSVAETKKSLGAVQNKFYLGHINTNTSLLTNEDSRLQQQTGESRGGGDTSSQKSPFKNTPYKTIGSFNQQKKSSAAGQQQQHNQSASHRRHQMEPPHYNPEVSERSELSQSLLSHKHPAGVSY